MAYYKYHIFFCLNQRNENEQCCNNFGAEDKFNYMKKKLKSLNLYGVNMCIDILIMKVLMKLLRNILTMERKLNAYWFRFSKIIAFNFFFVWVDILVFSNFFCFDQIEPG